MNTANDYSAQFAWRDWSSILNRLPAVTGRTVLDLGCGVGDLAAEFVDRGAKVIGVDANPELLRAARSKHLDRAEFQLADIREFRAPLLVDGIWCSFAAAYLLDLPATLASWSKSLREEGWIALTEVDDLFGHEPLADKTKAAFVAYAKDSLDAGRYDFHMGGKLRDHLVRSGFTLSDCFTVDDVELSFDGPAIPEVIDAWRGRFARMKLLRSFFGADFERIRDDFLACITHPRHASTAKVRCCIATKPAGETTAAND